MCIKSPGFRRRYRSLLDGEHVAVFIYQKDHRGRSGHVLGDEPTLCRPCNLVAPVGLWSTGHKAESSGRLKKARRQAYCADKIMAIGIFIYLVAVHAVA